MLLWRPIRMQHLEDLDYADIVLVSIQKNYIQAKLDILAGQVANVVLKINVGKMKAMNNNAPSKAFKVYGDLIKVIESVNVPG